jgi:hypothetical protein
MLEYLLVFITGNMQLFINVLCGNLLEHEQQHKCELLEKFQINFWLLNQPRTIECVCLTNLSHSNIALALCFKLI